MYDKINAMIVGRSGGDLTMDLSKKNVRQGKARGYLAKYGMKQRIWLIREAQIRSVTDVLDGRDLFWPVWMSTRGRACRYDYRISSCKVR